VRPAYWDEATAYLAKRDKVLRKFIRKYPEADITPRVDAFQALARAIVGQQISVAAAKTIWGRFADCVGKVTPANVVAKKPQELRACGFSRQKIAYVQDLANRFHVGEVKPRRWSRMKDEAIIEELVAVKGIGRWTVEMFLIFRLGRLDVLPVHDYGIRKAMQRAYRMRKLPTPDRMRKVAEPWRPYRTVACWYLWRSLESKAGRA
jgi:DNA-3-methyladenine glycosylase II